MEEKHFVSKISNSRNCCIAVNAKKIMAYKNKPTYRKYYRYIKVENRHT